MITRSTYILSIALLLSSCAGCASDQATKDIGTVVTPVTVHVGRPSSTAPAQVAADVDQITAAEDALFEQEATDDDDTVAASLVSEDCACSSETTTTTAYPAWVQQVGIAVMTQCLAAQKKASAWWHSFYAYVIAMVNKVVA